MNSTTLDFQTICPFLRLEILICSLHCHKFFKITMTMIPTLFINFFPNINLFQICFPKNALIKNHFVDFKIVYLIDNFTKDYEGYK